MSGLTRPIPIGHRGGSQRSSPTGSSDFGNDHAAQDHTSPGAMVSQSCPVNGHAAVFLRSATRYQPPRAPIIGSLPEPSFMLNETQEDAMPELILPPPAARDVPDSPRPASFVQFASSCPGDLGFLRQGPPIHQRSWAPSPRAMEEFDLSKSPALAVMSAMREGRHPRGTRRLSGDDRSSDAPRHSGSSPHFFREEDEDDDLTDALPMDRLTVDASHEERSSNLSEHPPLGLPPRRPERRGSYDGGIFHFEDQ